MADEKKWTQAVNKLATETESGPVSWTKGAFAPAIRQNVVGDGIYSTAVNGRLLIVYEYTYRNYTDVDEWTLETDVAIEFVDADGKLQWQWPKVPFRLQLLDAIRYRLSGAHDFLDSFLQRA